MSDLPPIVTEPSSPKTSAGSALTQPLRVFWEPTRVFGEIAERPSWLAAMIVLVLLGVGIQLVLSGRIDLEATVRQQVAERSGGREVSEAQIEQGVAIAKTFAPFGPAMAAVIVPMMVLVLAAVYLLGFKMFPGPLDFRRSLATVLHASVPPSVVGGLLTIVLALGRESMTGSEAETLVKSNLAAFLSTDVSKVVRTLAGFADVFVVWQIFLLVLGFSLVAKVRRSQAATVVGGAWVLWILVKLAWKAIF
jgi:hypothetical protein